MFGAIWQKTLGALRIFVPTFPFSYLLKQIHFKWLLSYVLGARRKKERSIVKTCR